MSEGEEPLLLHCDLWLTLYSIDNQGSNQADFLLAWPAHVRPAPFVACLCLLYIFFGLACLPVIFSGLPGLPVLACLNFYISIKMLISQK
jgi:hypothetical protein